MGLRIEVRLDVRDDGLRVRLLDTDLGRGVRGFRELDRRLPRIVAECPDVECEVDAGANVPHGVVIRTMDIARRAGVRDVTFVGAPPPGGSR